MNGGKSKKQLNALLRKNASSALFPILRDLGIQAALTHKAALALHQESLKAPKEIKVIVKHGGELTIEDLCTAVVSRDGYHFTRNMKKHCHLNYNSADPQTEGKICRVIFFLWGTDDSFPTILADFSEIVYISETPVLPVHAILLEQMIARSRLPVAKPLGKGIVNFMHKCLLASDRTPFQQLSPLWQSPEILDQIAQHVQKRPDAKKHWIARGIDPSIVTLAPSRGLLDVGAKDVDDGEGGGSDSDASEGPPAVVRAPNVAIQGRGHGHSAVTDIAAREVVSVLEQLGFECAILGTAASQLYSHGETRVPEQLDVLILPPASFTEHHGWLKQQIFNREPIQFEWNPRKGKLSYKFQPHIVLPSRCKGIRRCDIEILLPDSASLPYLSSSDVVWIDNLPVVPFLTLLLWKLQTWGSKLKPVNVRDVKRLLPLVPNLPVSVFRPWRERKLMSDEFQAASEARVKRFCSIFPETKPAWQMLGFDIEDGM